MIYIAYCHSGFLLRCFIFSIPLPEPLRKEKNRTYEKGKDALETNETIILCTSIQDKNILYIDSKIKNNSKTECNEMPTLIFWVHFVRNFQRLRK